MKRIMIFLVCIVYCFGSQAQDLTGAWERYHVSEHGDKLKSVVIFSEGYQVITTYDAISGTFISTNGGTWTLTNSTMTEKIEPPILY